MPHKLFGARLTLLRTEEGGRKNPLGSGYRSLFRFKGAGEFFGVELTTARDINPGGTDNVEARIWAGEFLPDLDPGDVVELFEGPHLVARGVVLSAPTSDI